MIRFLAWLMAGVLLLLVAALALLRLSLEDIPLVPPGEGLSPASIARAREIIRRNDPRKLARNETRQVSISGRDLEALLNLAAGRAMHGNAGLALRQDGAEVRLSTQLPANPLGRYVNVLAEIGVDEGQVHVSGVRIGRLPLPLPLFNALLRAGLRRADWVNEAELLQHSISQVALGPDSVRLTYLWRPELLDSARALVIGTAQSERLAAAHKRLVAKMDGLGNVGQAPLASILGPLLAEAGDVPTGERAQAYRDILFVLAFRLSGENIGSLIPEARQWPQPRPLTLTLRGREDLAQHFSVSAALAAWSGESLANAIGLEKEISDSQKGSGFSFIDLTADRSGTRLGELAVRNPERLAAAVAAGLSDAALLPAIDGLPEFMMNPEFQRRFGGVGAPAYKRMADEIERRIAAQALFR